MNLNQNQESKEYVLNMLFKTQNQEKIINNILNGKKYVRFIIRIDNGIMVIEKKSPLKDNIPIFNKKEIYLPYIEKGTLKNYIENYVEFNSLVTTSIENKKIFVDILKTSIAFKQKEIDINSTKTHDFILKKNIKRKEMIENYYLIYNFLKENYHVENKSNQAFYLNLSLNYLNLEFVEVINSVDHPLADLDYIFYISKEDLKILAELSVFNKLLHVKFLKHLIKESKLGILSLSEEIDIERTKDFIKTYNQIKNF